MEYRVLGRSGLKVSVLTMGTATFSGSEAFGQVDAAGALRQIDMCMDHGVNLFDTANAYARGVSEEMLGNVLSENGRRQKVLVASKVRFAMGDGPNDAGLSRQHIIEQCEASLKRLKTDVIDLYQAHEWDGVTPLEETMAAFDSLVRAGKVRYIGCSNFSGWHLMKALGISERALSARFISQQIHYTLFSREAEYELAPISMDQGLGILVWSPLAGGLLTGKYSRDKSPEGTRHTIGYQEPPIYDRERLFEIVDVIVEIAKERDVSGAQVALAWTLQRPGVSSIIIGGRTDDHIADNLKAVDLKLSGDEVKRLDVVSQPNLIYPYWHQVMHAKDRLSDADKVLVAPFLGN